MQSFRKKIRTRKEHRKYQKYQKYQNIKIKRTRHKQRIGGGLFSFGKKKAEPPTQEELDQLEELVREEAQFDRAEKKKEERKAVEKTIERIKQRKAKQDADQKSLEAELKKIEEETLRTAVDVARQTHKINQTKENKIALGLAATNLHTFLKSKQPLKGGKTRRKHRKNRK